MIKARDSSNSVEKQTPKMNFFNLHPCEGKENLTALQKKKDELIKTSITFDSYMQDTGLNYESLRLNQKSRKLGDITSMCNVKA